MATYQKVFPILFLSKGQEYKTLASIKDDDILSHGTGFFISEDGDFMSVGHNFHREKNNKKTYEVADFYAVLYEEGTKQPHLKEIDFNKVQVTYVEPILFDGKKRSIEFYEGKDIAIGKIDLQETDTVENPIRVNFELQIDTTKELSMFGYLQDKWIIENDNDPNPEGEKIANTTFYYHELKNRRLSEIGTHILRIDDGEQTFHTTDFDFKGEDGYKGLSGSPVFDENNCLVGIFYGPDEVKKSVSKKEDNSNKVESPEAPKPDISYLDYDTEPSEPPKSDYTTILRLVSVKNPHLKHIYNRFYHKLFVKATQSIKGYIKKGKDYKVQWEKGEHCREGEEFVKDDSGDKMTTICFTYEIKENNG